MSNRDRQPWPKFRPHPEDTSRCYTCGLTFGQHGVGSAHCPPANLERPPVSAVERHYDRNMDDLKGIADDLEILYLQMLPDDPKHLPPESASRVLQTYVARLRDLRVEISGALKAYPHPSIGQKAHAVLVTKVGELVYSDLVKAPLEPWQWNLVATVALIERTRAATTSSILAAGLAALGSSIVRDGAKIAAKEPTLDDYTPPDETGGEG